MTYQLAELQEHHIPIVCSFFHHTEDLCFAFPYASFPLTPSGFTEQTRDRSGLTVVLDKNRPVAFADMFDIVPGKHCYVGHIAVDPSMRGRGIARLLICSFAARARDMYGIPQMRLFCLSRNEKALLFYNRLGFRILGLHVFSCHGQPTPVLEMALDVESLDNQVSAGAHIP